MSDQDDVIIDAEGEENSRAQAASESDIEAEESRADAKAVKLRSELETIKKERQEYLDGWQRAKADYVNAIRRFDDERKSAEGRGIASALKALLPAMDALTRAKEHGDIPEGFAAIHRQLEGAFQSLGLEMFGAVGESFDPVQHEALGQDDVTEKEKDDTVTTVFEQGWRRGQEVIRPAKVRIGRFAGA